MLELYLAVALCIATVATIVQTLSSGGRDSAVAAMILWMMIGLAWPVFILALFFILISEIYAKK
jgi:predicted subunit of tRNA(5-methylaminomethyl-2-thiouridylate) methyltransferase